MTLRMFLVEWILGRIKKKKKKKKRELVEVFFIGRGKAGKDGKAQVFSL